MFLALAGPDARWTPVQISDPLDINSDQVAGAADAPGRLVVPQPAAVDARTDRWPLGLLQRKPDSGLGNIRSSPGSPSRNIDWVLLVAQAALAVIGLFVIYSASYTKFANPYLFVTRQEIFLIGAVVAMVVVMSVDYDWWQRAGQVPLRRSRSCSWCW